MGQLLRYFGLVLGLFLLACAKPSPQTASDPFAEFHELNRRLSTVTEPHISTGNLLAEYLAVQQLAIEIKREDDSIRNYVDQTLAELFARIGRPMEAHRASSTGSSAPVSVQPNASAWVGYEPRPALETLAELAPQQRVVFINEAHHVPQHRAFSILLLRHLRMAGFTHFAAETLYCVFLCVFLFLAFHPTRSTSAPTRQSWHRIPAKPPTVGWRPPYKTT